MIERILQTGSCMEKKDPDQVGVVKVDLVLVFGAEKGENVLMELSLRPLFLGRHALT